MQAQRRSGGEGKECWGIVRFCGAETPNISGAIVLYFYIWDGLLGIQSVSAQVGRRLLVRCDSLHKKAKITKKVIAPGCPDDYY